MRCLIVRDPWASRIVEGRKRREYRSRATNIRGRIGIIAGGTGQVIGTVEITDCQFDVAGQYAWILARPRKFASPVPYRHPPGAVVWVNVEGLPSPDLLGQGAAIDCPWGQDESFTEVAKRLR